MYTKLSIRTQMNVSPQLVMTGKLLEVPVSELEQFINRELADNPALRLPNKSHSLIENRQPARSVRQSGLSSASFSKRGVDGSASFEEIVENIAQHQSPLEKLTKQVSIALDKRDRAIAVALLHRLDHRGFLVIPAEQLASELGISSDTIVRVRQILHQLEPPGIGARDIKECFLLQCTHLEAEGVDCKQVRRILTLAWEDFLHQQWDRVARKIGQPKNVVEAACEFMRLNLDPHPLSILETPAEGIEILRYADLIVLCDEQAEPPAYRLEIPGEQDFELRIAESFHKILVPESRQGSGLSAQEARWIRMHLDRGLIVINALRQRWETLRRIGEYLVQRQRDFLEHGPLYLKPLTRAAVARDLDLHESTISRAVREKVIQLPNGRLMALSDFFDPSLSAKEAIRLLLRNAPKALCDREIAEGLQAKGMNVSRRTVTKYRREIKIDSSRPQSLGA